MPPKIRAILTATVIIVGILLCFVRERISLDVSAGLLFGLTAFMCVAVWLFPEVKKQDSTKR
ncbi:MAG: hypothetical protein J4F47_03670 [Alphaproteobacteria bacterium]|nr:hypothetical protein [Alphaproteobacteria bacterium]